MPDSDPHILIVGAGPAGLMAALEAARLGLNATVVSDEPAGGLALAARRFDNMPGYPGGVRAADWTASLVQQVRECGTVFVSARVRRAVRSGRNWAADTDAGQITAETVLLAVGTRPRHFPSPLPSSPLPSSPLVHRDIRGMPHDLADSRVVVIGAGEAALDSALSVRERGADVTLIARGWALKACSRLTSEFQTAAITTRFNLEIRAVVASERFVRLCPENGDDDIFAEHVVIATGREPRLDEIDLPDVPDIATIATANPAPGLFLAGDVLRDHARYVVSALGDGQRAACLAYDHIHNRSRS